MLVKWYLYIDGNYKRRVASVRNNITCGYIVTCCRGTSVARSLKLLALPYTLLKNQSNIQHHTSYKLQLRNITLYN